MWHFLFDPFRQVYVQKSLLEMLLIAVLSGVVSSYIVLRGTAFLASALAHAVFPGVVVSFLVSGNLFWGGLIAGLIVVVGVSLTERNQQVSENSAIGVLYVGAFALGIALISSIKNANTSGLETFLFGQLFGVGWEDLANTLIVSLIVLVAIFLARKELILASFDPQMGRAVGLPVGWISLGFLVVVTLTVVTGLPAVGNILMIALVITPGATARLLTERLSLMMLIATLSIVIASVVGIVTSYNLGLAPGACVVVALSGLFIVALAVSTFRQVANRRQLTTNSTLT